MKSTPKNHTMTYLIKSHDTLGKGYGWRECILVSFLFCSGISISKLSRFTYSEKKKEWIYLSNLRYCENNLEKFKGKVGNK